MYLGNAGQDSTTGTASDSIISEIVVILSRTVTQSIDALCQVQPVGVAYGSTTGQPARALGFRFRVDVCLGRVKHCCAALRGQPGRFLDGDRSYGYELGRDLRDCGHTCREDV